MLTSFFIGFQCDHTQNKKKMWHKADFGQATRIHILCPKDCQKIVVLPCSFPAKIINIDKYDHTYD